MSEHGIRSSVNTNPMIFEEIATSLATLASYARHDMDEPLQDLEHSYQRALRQPPSYTEITSLAGHSLTTVDRQCGRAAWLLMNTEGLEVYAVHSRVWHKVGKRYSAPLLDQMSRAVGVDSQLTDDQIQKLGVELARIDVVGVKDNAIWLVQVMSSNDVVDSAFGRSHGSSGKLFRSAVYSNVAIDQKKLDSLFAAYQQMRLAFPKTDVATLALVMHPTGPDFELYQIDLCGKPRKPLILEEGKIRRNSIDYADRLNEDRDALFALPELLDNRLFRGMPPCRGGRTLGMLASAVTRQLDSRELLVWKRNDFIQMLREDFDYDVETDKVRHDLDDRLVAQGFFRKWANAYFVSPKGIARYQYCLNKFTNQGNPRFDLDLLITQRDGILERFGCLH